MGRSTDDLDDLFTDEVMGNTTKSWQQFFSVWDIPALFVFTALFFTVLLQFLTRYVLNDSLSWTEEAARYLLILLAFTGALRCQLRDTHIRLEFIDGFAGRMLRPIKIFATLVTTGMFGFLIYSLYILARQTSFQKMVSLPFPKYYLYALVLVALAALVVLQQRQLWRLLKGGDA
ncbi:TRAP transporter small permease [Shimia sp. MIT910701]|jgi:TRAP-type C4-dicarboxylate transport system permease small subunit|uniref:TRAP transporter small permease n=1 Tax=Shimia sp. MIT910701 TaxID=3096987 RepID=UPI003999D706